MQSFHKVQSKINKTFLVSFSSSVIELRLKLGLGFKLLELKNSLKALAVLRNIIAMLLHGFEINIFFF